MVSDKETDDLPLSKMADMASIYKSIQPIVMMYIMIGLKLDDEAICKCI